MPYIPQQDRDTYQTQINDLISIIQDNAATCGDLNYIITRIVNGYLQGIGVKYSTFNSVIGVLECVKQELYRRSVVPYEELKKKMNGDVF